MAETPVGVYCDGACLGNPGPGGWAALLVANTPSGPREKMLSGATADTTNNRMELQAAIEGLSALTKSCHVHVVTDSDYVVKGMTTWIKQWQANGWRGTNRKPVKNQDLWELLEEAAARHVVTWEWVRGHSGHAYNERVDQQARDAATAIKMELHRAGR